MTERPHSPTRRQLKRSWRWFRWRGTAALVVFGCGLAAFVMGAEVSARAGLPDAGAMTQIYYSLGLFVLGGLDLGVPSGGPDEARVLLWFAYFAAPAISVSALVEGILRAIGGRGWRFRRMRDHIVIAGCGRLAMLVLERLRALDDTCDVVVIERTPDRARVDEARDTYRSHVLYGDITRSATRRQLRLDHARQVLLLTGDDFVNLDAAFAIREEAPELHGRITAHVSDLRTMRVVHAASARAGCKLFNTYHLAARHLVSSRLLGHFARTEPRDVVVLAGFGRFGQTVLAELQEQAAGQFKTVVIVDIAAEMSAGVFNDQVGFHDDYERTVVEGDLRDPRVWHKLRDHIDFGSHEPVIVLSSGDDTTNIRTAMGLAKRFPDAYVVARTFRPSAFGTTVSRESGFDLIAVSELVGRSMPDSWFAERRPGVTSAFVRPGRPPAIDPL